VSDATVSMLKLPDGRSLEVRRVGEPTLGTLTYHHGTPSAAVEFDLLELAAVAEGFEVLCWSRPGYGTSTPHPGRRVVDDLVATRAVLQHFDVDAFVALGWSGGGPHALAAATLETCRGVATLGGVAPSDAPDLDFLAAMARANVEEFTLAAEDGPAFAAALEAGAAIFPSLTVADLEGVLDGLLAPADLALLDGPLGHHLLASLGHAVASGPAGWHDDDRCFLMPWGFSVGAVEVPALVVHGGADQMVPVAHGRWLATHLPRGELLILDDDGHLSPWRLVADLCARLAEELRRS